MNSAGAQAGKFAAKAGHLKRGNNDGLGSTPLSEILDLFILDGQQASTMRRLLFCRTMHLKYREKIRSAPLTPFPLLCYP